jgi:FtsH-binding integral membrane protein
MRSLVYEIFGLGLLVSSLVFFYQCISFLAEKDYIAGFVVLAIGFFVLRTGSELGKLAVLVRREEAP